RYGPPEVLEVREVARPVPRDREVLVRIHATAVTYSECAIRSGAPSAPLPFRMMLWLMFGYRRPRQPILGSSLAGEVVEIGKRVPRFRPGDRVFAFTIMRGGGYAEYTCVPEGSFVATVPSNLTYEQAAALPYGALLALHFVGDGSVEGGQS